MRTVTRINFLNKYCTPNGSGDGVRMLKFLSDHYEEGIISLDDSLESKIGSFYDVFRSSRGVRYNINYLKREGALVASGKRR